MPPHNDVLVSRGRGWGGSAGDESISRTARFVIMIAMLMMALLLQLKILVTTAAAVTITSTKPVSAKSYTMLLLHSQHTKYTCSTV